MILGVVRFRGGPDVRFPRDELTEEGWTVRRPRDTVLLGSRRIFRGPGYLAPPPGDGGSDRLTVALCGRPSFRRVSSRPDRGTGGTDPIGTVAALYREFGAEFPARMDGKFAAAVWDDAERRLVLARDRFGVEPLYFSFAEGDGVVAFGSTTMVLRRLLPGAATVNLSTLGKVLTFDYNPGRDTVFEGIRKVGPGRTLVAGSEGISEGRYWRLTFSESIDAGEERVCRELRDLLRSAVARRTDDGPRPPGVFVSGGMDSSTVLEYCARASRSGVNAFSYRCGQADFDESRYARIMADHAGASHHLIDYRPEAVTLTTELVDQMSEPFCELGITVASYLLGREAAGRSDYALTGDGGDELFGGHPVYEADKVARFVDPIPWPVKAPVLAVARRLPDTRRKQDLTVKAKRFAESLRLPRDLGTHRWRVYYTPRELRSLLMPEVAAELEGIDLFEDVRRINGEARGPDLLSRSLYSDYFTQVDFYLRRNDLNRAFGLETRYPLLDRELVEYCARLPSSLKVRGWFDSKYILHRAVEGVLPDEVVHREDKMGHSIPLKNWLRDDTAARDFVLDHLSEETVRRRGLFRPAAIREMVDEHTSRRRNHSHRLWALTLLEVWLQSHVDQ